jgi:hypothetical protein
MNWLWQWITGSGKQNPVNDTSSEEMDEMIFNDPEGDEWNDQLPRTNPPGPDTDETEAVSPPEPPKGWLARLLGF